MAQSSTPAAGGACLLLWAWARQGFSGRRPRSVKSWLPRRRTRFKWRYSTPTECVMMTLCKTSPKRVAWHIRRHSSPA